MLKFLKKNKIIVASILLFGLVYFFGNNMEFYKNSKTDSFPRKINEPSGEFELDATDDIVLERRDLKQLQSEKIGRRNYDGLDGFPGVLKGWWADATPVADNLYQAPSRMVWPD